jgi:hypothetical protein
MTLFKYWNNSKIYHGELLAEIVANSITEADAKFVSLTKLNPVKCSWIGVECITL